MLDGWKTIILNCGFAVIGVLEAVEWTHIIDDPSKATLAVTLVAVANIVMRHFTHDPAGYKKEK